MQHTLINLTKLEVELVTQRSNLTQWIMHFIFYLFFAIQQQHSYKKKQFIHRTYVYL